MPVPANSHGGAAAVSPLVLTANTPNETPLTLQLAATQNFDALDVLDATSNVVFGVEGDGTVDTGNGTGRIDASGAARFDKSVSVGGAGSSAGITITPQSGGQTADLLGVFDASGVKRCRVSNAAFTIIKVTSAPADASLAASEFTLWLDATPGVTALNVKAKDSGGTVRTATIPLT